MGAPEFNSTILLRIQEPFGSLTPFSVNQDGLLIASGNERKPDLVCRQVQHLFFFFFPQMECVANVEKLGHCTYGSEFSDLLKNYWIWHHWPLISWSHQLAVQDGLPPDPRVCSSAPCGTTCPYCVSLPPMLLHPTFHL